jgi:ComF family protein
VVRVLRSTPKSTLDSLSTVLFPADCRVCGNPLPGFSRLPVCDFCWKQLPSQSGVLCVCCGEALGVDPSIAVSLDELLCRPCRQVAPPFNKAVAHGAYRGNLRALLHLLKYQGLTPIAARLGILLAEQVLAIPGLPAELTVIAVPLFRSKRRIRQFNQAELLARATTRIMRRRRPELRVRLALGVLERQRSTESQAGLSPHQRRANLRGAFFVARPEAVKGRNVLLIDDIYTTGATARACSQALRRAGAESVWVATVARAQKDEALRAISEMEDLPMEEDIALWESAGENETVNQTAGER